MKLTSSALALSLLGLAVLATAGCTTPPGAAEKTARNDMTRIGRDLRPPHATARLPVLSADAPLEQFVLYGVLNHPSVAAAYYDWRADVEAIAPNRALPDPQLTFEADITDTLMTLMPGLMFDFMGPGKRASMAREATATSTIAYRAYVAAVTKAAANVRKAWVELAYANEVAGLYHQTVGAAEEAVALANAEYASGRGMGNFEAQIRFQNLAAQHHAHHAAVADRVVAAKSRLKAALGLLPTDPDPAWPAAKLTVTPIPADDELWRRAQAANPELARMRAMVDMTIAGVEVARNGGVPDFTVGVMADLKAKPRMIRPTATLTLPIWREKIRANIAAAEARRDAAAARLSAEQLDMAAELAQMLYMVRESDRMLDYIDRVALPNLERSLASVEAGLQSGMVTPTMLPEVRLMALDMRHERLDALRDREAAAVDLAAMLADVTPAGAPLLAADLQRPGSAPLNSTHQPDTRRTFGAHQH